MNTGSESAGDAVSYSPSIRIVRGHAFIGNPCAALQELAVQSYGPLAALRVSLLRSWYKKNNSIFKIAVTSDNSVVGYLLSLPLFANIFERTLAAVFQEKSIAADDLDGSLCAAGGGIFISSIVVAPEYRSQSPASLLLRLAFIEDLIANCSEQNQAVRLSAQVLSPRGESCMRSLGLKARGLTTCSWKVYYGRLGRTDLLGIREELQRKLAGRFRYPGIGLFLI